MDVHATKIVVAGLDAEPDELCFCAMTADIGRTVAFCAALPRPVRVPYEADPTGYGLARERPKRRRECVVAAAALEPW